MRRCDACGAELTPVFADLCRRRTDTPMTAREATHRRALAEWAER